MVCVKRSNQVILTIFGRASAGARVRKYRSHGWVLSLRMMRRARVLIRCLIILFGHEDVEGPGFTQIPMHLYRLAGASVDHRYGRA